MHLNALESIYSEKKINLSKSKGKLISEKKSLQSFPLKNVPNSTSQLFQFMLKKKLRMVIWHIFEETTKY